MTHMCVVCLCSRAHTCRAVRAVSRVTVTLLDQSLLTVTRAVSVAVSPASLDRSVTAALRDTSAFRRAAVHVSIDL